MFHHSLSITGPTGRSLLYYPEGGRFSAPPTATAQAMREDWHNSSNEKPQYMEHPVYSRRHFAWNSSPNSALSSVIVFLSFALQTCLWLCHKLLVPNCNSLPFLNKSIFSGKITDNFILKLNRGQVDHLSVFSIELMGFWVVRGIV